MYRYQGSAPGIPHSSDDEDVDLIACSVRKYVDRKRTNQVRKSITELTGRLKGGEDEPVTS